MPASAVGTGARRAGSESKVRNAGANERARFGAPKLARAAAGGHANRAVGLPSAVSGAATSAYEA